MKRTVMAGIVVGLLLTLGSPAMAAKFAFDLSKGPVSFAYTTIGAYNPTRVTVIGNNGVAQTWFTSDYYESETFLQTLGELLLAQRAAVPWVDLNVESLTGKLSFQASTEDGVELSVKMEGAQGNITVRVNSGGAKGDTGDKEVRAQVQVDAESGLLTIEDSQPRPDVSVLLGQRYRMPWEQIHQLLDQFGKSRVLSAFQYASSHVGPTIAQNGAVAGEAASVVSDGSVSINNLSPQAVFDLSLRGLKYQGFLRDSTLYMRLYHPANGVSIRPANGVSIRPANGVSIRDMQVILTVVELNPPEPLHGPHIVLWDVFPYDYQAGCYLYHLNSTGWRPGSYEVYIDVGKIVNFKLPITITDWHQVVARRG